MKWKNERFETYAQSVKAQFPIVELGTIVKIENVVAVKIPDGSSRVVYPYFSETPTLPTEGARLGLWALGEALGEFRPEDFRIIDILRQAYFRPSELTFQGNERAVFVQRYDAVLKEWKRLGGGP